MQHSQQKRNTYSALNVGTLDGAVLAWLFETTNNIFASLVAQRSRICVPVQETWVQFLDWEDPLEKEMTTHSSILGWEIPWTEEPGGLWSMELQRVRYDLVTEQQPKYNQGSVLWKFCPWRPLSSALSSYRWHQLLHIPGDSLLTLTAAASAFSFAAPPPRSFSSSAVPISASWPILDTGSLAFPPLPCPSLQFSQFGLFLLCCSPTLTLSARGALDHQAPLLSFSLLLSQALSYLVWQSLPLCPDSVALPPCGLCRAASRHELTARQLFSLPLGFKNRADIEDLPFSEYSVFLWPFSRFIWPN